MYKSYILVDPIYWYKNISQAICSHHQGTVEVNLLEHLQRGILLNGSNSKTRQQCRGYGGGQIEIINTDGKVKV